jgi:hypothetical protein
MKRLRIFVASSGSLADDRRELEVYVSRLNDRLVAKNAYVELWLWEKFSRAFTKERKQDEFNKAIDTSDLFLCLIHDRFGQFSKEELAWAIEQFRLHSSPRIVVFFKSAPVDPTTLTDAFEAVVEARATISQLGQVWDTYATSAELCLGLDRELSPILEALSDKDQQADEVQHISNSVVIDLMDERGSNAHLWRSTHLRALRHVDRLFDRISTDGELVQSSLIVSPGRVATQQWEENAWNIETTLDAPLEPGAQVLKTIAATIKNGFLGSSEYWMDRQLGVRGLGALEVRFPRDRPPLTWSSERRIKYDNLPSPSVDMFRFDGRTILRTQWVGEVPFEIYYLRWTW